MEVGKSEWIVDVLWRKSGQNGDFILYVCHHTKYGRYTWPVCFVLLLNICALFLYLNVGHSEILI